jgi:hypothetical protein
MTSDPIQAKLDALREAQWIPVKPGSKAVTPPPWVDVLQVLPELASQARTAVRLHPRHNPDLPADASKIGGMFLWPADEPWPVCSEHREPYVTAMQLRAEEFPEMQFRPGTDLFQWLWCANPDHGWVQSAVYWRRRASIAKALEIMPKPRRANITFVPAPCVLLPERVIEYPPPQLLSPSQIQRLEAWSVAPLLAPQARARLDLSSIEGFYQGELATCPGTKIGGYPYYYQSPSPRPQSPSGKPTEFLVTISAYEFGVREQLRWEPQEDPQYIAASKGRVPGMWVYQRISACQLFGEGQQRLWIDRSMPDWPVFDDSDSS